MGRPWRRALHTLPYLYGVPRRTKHRSVAVVFVAVCGKIVTHCRQSETRRWQSVLWAMFMSVQQPQNAVDYVEVVRILDHRICLIQKVRWPSGLRRQLKVLLHSTSYNRWSERAWVQIPLSSTYLLLWLTVVPPFTLLSSASRSFRPEH